MRIDVPTYYLESTKMKFDNLHSWDVTPAEAKRLQDKLRKKLIIDGDPGKIRLVGGIDVGYSRTTNKATAGVVVLTVPDMTLIETAAANRHVTFPYVPGLLAFREIPAVLSAIELLENEPDVFIVDGHGLAHPRRFGFASHLGLLLDRPTIGCAKSRLIGEYEEPGPNFGDRTVLTEGDERIGSVIRTKSSANPIFISPGHKIGFEPAERIILECSRGHKLPEPTRLAHRLVKRAVTKASL